MIELAVAGGYCNKCAVFQIQNQVYRWSQQPRRVDKAEHYVEKFKDSTRKRPYGGGEMDRK